MGSVLLRSIVVRGMMASIGFGLMLGLAGCARKPISPQPMSPLRRSPQATATAPSAQELARAKDVVVQYLNALYDQNFQAAYTLLSEPSKQQHSFDEFKRDAAGAQIAYDMASARAESTDTGGIKVIVDMEKEEEPGAKAFDTAQEKGEWKVVYFGGKPFAPYGE